MLVCQNYLSRNLCESMMSRFKLDFSLVDSEKLPIYFTYNTVYNKQLYEPELPNLLWRTDVDFPLYEDEFGDLFEPVGFNPDITFLWYKPGYSMRLHTDSYPTDQWDVVYPMQTVIFLNEPEGGDLVFPRTKNFPQRTIAPKIGKMVAFFTEDRPHAVREVKTDRYVVVTNVEYRIKLCKDEEVRKRIFELEKELQKLDEKIDTNFDEFKSEKCQKTIHEKNRQLNELRDRYISGDLF